MKIIKDFFLGLSDSIGKGLSVEIQKRISDAIGDGIEEGIDKSGKQLFSIGISIVLIGTGFFLTTWGIATMLDIIFAIRGIGYMIIGIFAILIGLIYMKYQ